MGHKKLLYALSLIVLIGIACKNRVKAKEHTNALLLNGKAVITGIIKLKKDKNIVEVITPGIEIKTLYKQCRSCFKKGFNVRKIPDFLPVQCVLKGKDRSEKGRLDLKNYKIETCVVLWKKIKGIKIKAFKRGSKMGKKVDVVSGEVIETFDSPAKDGWVEVKYGDRKLTWAKKVQLEVHYKDTTPTVVRMNAVFWRTELITMAEAGKVINMKLDELIKFKPGKDIQVILEGKDVLKKAVADGLKAGKKLEDILTEVGPDGFPLFLDLENYEVKDVVQLVEEEKEVTE